MKFKFKDQIEVIKGFYKGATGTILDYNWFFGIGYIIDFNDCIRRISGKNLELLASQGDYKKN